MVQQDVTFECFGEIIRKSDLDKSFEPLRGYALLAGLGKEWLNEDADKLALIYSLYEQVPLALKTLPNTEFKVEFSRFPYEINGDKAYCSYSLRLVPKSGGVTEVKVHNTTGLAINYQKMTNSKLEMDTGNGSLHIEVFFSPQNITEKLKPVLGFKDSVKFKEEDYID